MTTRAGLLRRRIYAATVLIAATLAGGAAAAGASPPAGTPGAPDTPPDVSTSTAVNYTCFVTYNGGATTVNYSLTFTTTAPATAGPHRRYTAEVASPQITPNPNINTAVQDVRVVFAAPPGGRVLAARTSGGSGLGDAGARVEVAHGTAVLTAHGPFAGGQAFTLPTVRLAVRAGTSGSAAVSAGGATLADPQFSWVRTDPSDGTTMRPFACFTPPVPLSTTTVTG